VQNCVAKLLIPWGAQFDSCTAGKKVFGNSRLTGGWARFVTPVDSPRAARDGSILSSSVYPAFQFHCAPKGGNCLQRELENKPFIVNAEPKLAPFSHFGVRKGSQAAWGPGDGNLKAFLKG
jgi:hypothetical protein